MHMHENINRVRGRRKAFPPCRFSISLSYMSHCVIHKYSGFISSLKAWSNPVLCWKMSLMTSLNCQRGRHTITSCLIMLSSFFISPVPEASLKLLTYFWNNNKKQPFTLSFTPEANWDSHRPHRWTVNLFWIAEHWHVQAQCDECAQQNCSCSPYVLDFHQLCNELRDKHSTSS